MEISYQVFILSGAAPRKNWENKKAVAKEFRSFAATGFLKPPFNKLAKNLAESNFVFVDSVLAW